MYFKVYTHIHKHNYNVNIKQQYTSYEGTFLKYKKSKKITVYTPKSFYEI